MLVHSAAPLLLLALCLAPAPATAAAPPGYNLEQLHVVFRHGNRTPEAPYKNDPNTDYMWPPTGWDQLNKAGIESTYRLGLLFRQMYGDFLGDTYYQTDVNATSTDIPRTKLSLQAFMAGLFPARGVQQWDAASGMLGALWQPFVYHYMPKHLDDFLYMKGVDCPRYAKEYAEALRGDKVKQFLESDPDMMQVLRGKGVLTTNTIASLSSFYCTVSIETDQGRLVPDWVKPFYPERLEKVALYHFHARVLTRSLQRVLAGPLVKHLVSTMRETRDGAKNKPRLWIYSGHDDTVSALGMATHVWGAVYPHFNAMLVLELLKSDSGEYAVQVLLREGHGFDAHVVPVEGCGASPCPLDKFHELVKDVIPGDWRKECQLGDEKRRPQLLRPATENGTIPAKNKV